MGNTFRSARLKSTIAGSGKGSKAGSRRSALAEVVVELQVTDTVCGERAVEIIIKSQIFEDCNV
jgi:hypothetical protein